MDKFTARFRRALDEHPEQATEIRRAFIAEGRRLLRSEPRKTRVKAGINGIRVTYLQWLAAR